MYQDNDDGYTWSYNLKPKEKRKKEFIKHLGRHTTFSTNNKNQVGYCHLCDWSNKKNPFGYIYYPF